MCIFFCRRITKGTKVEDEDLDSDVQDEIQRANAYTADSSSKIMSLLLHLVADSQSHVIC